MYRSMDSQSSVPVSDFSSLSLGMTRSDDLEEQLRFFKNNSLYTDVNFRVTCGEGYLPFAAHRLLLSMWSPVLASELLAGQSTIEVNDVLPSAFESVLKFVYGMPPIDRRDRSDVGFVLRVYRAAVKYQIPLLSKMCLDYLTFIFPTADNVFELLTASKHIESRILEERCNKLIQAKTTEVIKLMGDENITLEIVKTILSMPCVSFSCPFELVDWALTWAKKYNSSALPQVKAKILPDILRLRSDEFGRLFKKHNEVFDEREGFGIFMNIVELGSWDIQGEIPNGSGVPRSYL